MDKDLRELLQQYVNLEFDQLVALCKEDAMVFLNVMNTIYENQDESFKKFILAIASIICVDGVVNIKEWKFFNALFEQDIDFDTFNEIVKDQNKAALRNDFDAFVDAIGSQVDNNLKLSIVNVMIGFAACNEKITPEEIEYIEKLIA